MTDEKINKRLEDMKRVGEMKRDYYKFTALIKRSAVKEKKGRRGIKNQISAVLERVFKEEKNNVVVVCSGPNDFPMMLNEDE